MHTINHIEASPAKRNSRHLMHGRQARFQSDRQEGQRGKRGGNPPDSPTPSRIAHKPAASDRLATVPHTCADIPPMWWLSSSMSRCSYPNLIPAPELATAVSVGCSTVVLNSSAIEELSAEWTAAHATAVDQVARWHCPVAAEAPPERDLSPPHAVSQAVLYRVVPLLEPHDSRLVVVAT